MAMPKLDIGYVNDEMTGQPDGDEDEGHGAGRRRGLGWVDANDSPAPKRRRFDGSRASRDVRSDDEFLPVSPAQATNGTNADVNMDPDDADDAQTGHGGPTGGFRLHLHASRPVNITVDVPRPPVLDPRRQTPPPDDSGRWPGYDEGEAGEVQPADWDSADQPRAQGGIERRGGYDSSDLHDGEPRSPAHSPHRQTPPPDDSGRWPDYDEEEAGEAEAAGWESAGETTAQGGTGGGFYDSDSQDSGEPRGPASDTGEYERTYDESFLEGSGHPAREADEEGNSPEFYANEDGHDDHARPRSASRSPSYSASLSPSRPPSRSPSHGDADHEQDAAEYDDHADGAGDGSDPEFHEDPEAHEDAESPECAGGYNDAGGYSDAGGYDSAGAYSDAGWGEDAW